MQDMFVTDWGKERIIISYAKISVFLIIEISQTSNPQLRAYMIQKRK